VITVITDRLNSTVTPDVRSNCYTHLLWIRGIVESIISETC